MAWSTRSKVTRSSSRPNRSRTVLDLNNDFVTPQMWWVKWDWWGWGEWILDKLCDIYDLFCEWIGDPSDQPPCGDTPPDPCGWEWEPPCPETWCDEWLTLNEETGLCELPVVTECPPVTKWRMNTILRAFAWGDYTYDWQTYTNIWSQQQFVAEANANWVDFYLEDSGTLCLDTAPAWPICRITEWNEACQCFVEVEQTYTVSWTECIPNEPTLSCPEWYKLNENQSACMPPEEPQTCPVLIVSDLEEIDEDWNVVWPVEYPHVATNSYRNVKQTISLPEWFDCLKDNPLTKLKFRMTFDHSAENPWDGNNSWHRQFRLQLDPIANNAPISSVERCDQSDTNDWLTNIWSSSATIWYNAWSANWPRAVRRVEFESTIWTLLWWLCIRSQFFGAVDASDCIETIHSYTFEMLESAQATIEEICDC